MNIDAKISSEPLRYSTSAPARESVNEPLGEAYSAYWNWWLRNFVKLAQMRYPEVFCQKGPEVAKPDPLSRVGLLHSARGCGAVFELSRALGRPTGFDVISHVLTSAPTVTDLVRRWSGVLAMQSEIRFPSGTRSQDFIAVDCAKALVLSPHAVRPANQRPFGPAMLGGVALGTLESAGVEVHSVWSVARSGATHPVFRFGTFVGNHIAFDSDLVIVLSDEAPALTGEFRLKPPERGLALNHLVQGAHQLGLNRLVGRVVGALDAAEGDHPTLAATAAGLGLSARSLSRRLNEANVGYGRLARFEGYRHAGRR
ncbi:hypothetical protein [Roseibium sp. M-1]